MIEIGAIGEEDCKKLYEILAKRASHIKIDPELVSEEMIKRMKMAPVLDAMK